WRTGRAVKPHPCAIIGGGASSIVPVWCRDQKAPCSARCAAHPTLCKGPSALASPTPKDDPGCARRLAFGRDGLGPACRPKLTLLKGHGGRRSPRSFAHGRILP